MRIQYRIGITVRDVHGLHSTESLTIVVEGEMGEMCASAKKALCDMSRWVSDGNFPKENSPDRLLPHKSRTCKFSKSPKKIINNQSQQHLDMNECGSDINTAQVVERELKGG